MQASLSQLGEVAMSPHTNDNRVPLFKTLVLETSSLLLVGSTTHCAALEHEYECRNTAVLPNKASFETLTGFHSGDYISPSP